VNSDAFALQALRVIEAAGLSRSMRRVDSSQQVEILLDGQRVLNFSSNNCLGLATHPALAAAATAAIQRYGLGSGASRLISGTMGPHLALEAELATWLGRERALLFPSGFQANTGVIPALAGPDTVILSDALNHASLIDGMRLSRAERRIFPHNDVDALAALLRQIQPSTPVLVVTESLFSMAGDRARLLEIAALKRLRPFLLYVDEAHALGACGPEGRGLVAEAGVNGSVDLLLGTLGKAFGVSGAFVSGSAPVMDLLVNRARSFIYTTAPMPLLAQSARRALRLVCEGEALRDTLRRNQQIFRSLVSASLTEPAAGRDHIVPVPCGSPERAMAACAALLERGIFCQALRPPTVPRRASCLRFSLSAEHTDAQLQQAAAALHQALQRGAHLGP